MIKKVVQALFILILLVGGLAVPSRVEAAGSTIIVESVNDNVVRDDQCTLREAILSANFNGAIVNGAEGVVDCAPGSTTGTDVIVLDERIYDFQIPIDTTPDPKQDEGLWGDMDIYGPTTIQGRGPGKTILGNDKFFSSRYFQVRYKDGVSPSARYAVTFIGMTIRYANATGSTTDETRGGAINNIGQTVVVNNVEFTSNAALDSGGAIANNNVDNGGPIGILSVTMSSFVSNTAAFQGGGILNDGQLTLTNSLFSSNVVTSEDSGYGGALTNAPGGVATVENVTFNSNKGLIGGAVYSQSNMIMRYSLITNSIGPGLTLPGVAKGSIMATIIANQSTGYPNCYLTAGTQVTSGGFNYENNDSSGVTGTCAGVFTNELLDQNAVTDLKLGSLGTHPANPSAPKMFLIAADSSSVDKIDSSVYYCPGSDQGWGARPVGLCDIGPYERGSVVRKTYLPVTSR